MRIVFMGTPESAVPSLRRLVDDGHEIVAVWTQPDRPAGRGNKLHQSPVKEFALQQGLSIHQPAKIKTPEAKDLFSSHNANAAIVVAYGKILPSEFLNAYPHGCINVHFSLLPKYRGAAPVNWAIVNGEKETGVTTMKIVDELDAGPILRQQSSPIEAEETAPQLLNRLAGIGADLLTETLHSLNEIVPKPQKDDEATFAPILKREDGLIDWSMDAFAIARRVRGFQPWPNAHTTFKSRHFIVWEASAERAPGSAATSGEIVKVETDNLMVAAGDSTVLLISTVQLEGARRMAARDFINGSHPQVGTVLGK
ncbi:MAG TPA: methionyl-tRNA formyltransferase [Pyrinomonadaceae bacterium]|nr:methionyl-tRNA formyltransferase [Pyrinomonadaceae bacterium]